MHRLLADPPTFNGYDDFNCKLTRLTNEKSTDTDS